MFSYILLTVFFAVKYKNGGYVLKMKLKIWELSMITALAISILCGFMLNNDQRELSEKMIRLHVMANSDTYEDQELKMQVRDAILDEIAALTAGAADKSDAERIIKENLNTVTNCAEKKIRSMGKSYSVTAEVTRENFPTRYYDTFSLPAGEYTSLRVEIGEGRGHNWWCVVFPPICTAAAISSDTAAISLSDDEISLITKESGEYVIKFKAMEIVERIKAFITGEN